MKTNQIIEETEEEKIEAPFFGLEKWRKEKGLVSQEIEAYVEKRNEQTLTVMFLTALIIVAVHYIRYGVL